MAPPRRPLYAAAALGATAAIAKAVYSFLLPAFLVFDAIGFLALGYFVGGRGRHNRAWELTALLAAPSALLAAFIVLRAGTDFFSGTGIDWAVSAVLVPLAAYAGVHAARRRKPRAPAAHSA